MVSLIHKLYVRYLVWRDKAINVWSKSPYPANVLSNLHPNAFEFDGIACGSMEGFLQSLKYADEEDQKTICALSGKDAKRKSIDGWKDNQILHWKGAIIKRSSKEFMDLLTRAYKALYCQNDTFRLALLATKGKPIFHTQGNPNPKDTILTEKEFCNMLDCLRTTPPFISEDEQER